MQIFVKKGANQEESGTSVPWRSLRNKSSTRFMQICQIVVGTRIARMALNVTRNITIFRGIL